MKLHIIKIFFFFLVISTFSFSVEKACEWCIIGTKYLHSLFTFPIILELTGLLVSKYMNIYPPKYYNKMSFLRMSLLLPSSPILSMLRLSFYLSLSLYKSGLLSFSSSSSSNNCEPKLCRISSPFSSLFILDSISSLILPKFG